MGFTIEIPAAPALVIDQLNKSGFQAYAVGGCVRDSLLGLKPNDWDVCTSAQPDEILACFANQRTIPTGYQHGTVTVMINDLPIEVTTYRIDGSYTDGRHPDGVVFTPCLEEDLARRDFTVNAMAYHPREGLVDCYNGCEDLKNKVLRCVGDPKKRFTEDALRILRAYRFASQLGLSIEKNTEMAAEELIANVSLVATERVYQEISKLICGPWAGRVLATYPTILKHVLPFWQSVPMDILNKIDRLSKDVSFRFGAIYCGNPNAKSALLQLKAPSRLVGEVAFIAKYGVSPMTEDRVALQKFIYHNGDTRVQLLARFQKELGFLSPEAESELTYIKEHHLCCELKQLVVSGNDLLQVGFAADRHLGERLEQLLFAVIEQKVPNEKQALIQWALKME